LLAFWQNSANTVGMTGGFTFVATSGSFSQLLQLYKGLLGFNRASYFILKIAEMGHEFVTSAHPPRLNPSLTFASEIQ